jgi:cysteine synthase
MIIRRKLLKNVFAGPDGMKDFLNPDCHLPTPFVELDDSLNHLRKDRVRIFAKLQYLSPLLTGKWFVAYKMLQEAYESGGLKGVIKLIENSSGGTALALKIVAEVVFGIHLMDAIVPRDMAPSKLEGLRLMGINYRFSDASPGGLKGTDEARLLGKEPGSFCGDQYMNDANWRAHEKWMAPELWDQSDGKLTHYYAPGGTCGHLLGPSEFFKKIGANVKVRVVTPTEDQVPGARGVQRIWDDVKFMEDDKLGLKELIDNRIEIKPKDAYKGSLALWRRGILAGPSGGMTYKGTLEDLEATRKDWDSRRNSDGEIIAAFSCVDVALQYAEKYSTHLSAAELV